MKPYKLAGKAPVEKWTSERCHILELLNDSHLQQVSLAECRVEPGVITELHSLSVAEWYIIRAGSGMMEVAGSEPFPVEAGDVVEIPPRAAQRIRNTGIEDLRFQCLCMPRFTPDCYESLERDAERD